MNRRSAGASSVHVVGRPNNERLETSYLGPFGRILPYSNRGPTLQSDQLQPAITAAANIPAVAHVFRFSSAPANPIHRPDLDVSFGLIGGNNYGFCMGDWTVWLGVNGGPGPVRPSASIWEALGRLYRRHQPDAADVGGQELSALHPRLPFAQEHQRSQRHPAAQCRPPDRSPGIFLRSVVRFCRTAIRNGPK